MRSYLYRCYPTTAQAETLHRWQIACHQVQRLCVKERREYERIRRERTWLKPPTWAVQGRDVTAVRKVDSFWNDVPADTMSAVVKRVDQAWRKMWSERKNGKWKAKARWARTAQEVGLTFRGGARGTRIIAETSRYAYWQLAGAGKLGSLKVRMHRPMPAPPEQVHVTRRADGWYVSFVVDIPQPEPHDESAVVIGVDLNVKHEQDTQQVAAVSDGRVYTQPDGLKRSAQALAHLQKMVDPKRKTKTRKGKTADPESNRSKHRRIRIARLHQRIARQRRHNQEYIARRLVDTAQTVVFEEINWKALRTKGKGRCKRGLNRAMSTAAPGALVALTEDKAQLAGRNVAKVDPRYTSQTCNDCGARTKLSLRDRTWTCRSCGTVHDRDINAAKNIRDRYTGTFSAGVRGEGACVSDTEQCPVNREAADLPQARSNRAAHQIQTDTVRNSRQIRHENRVSEKVFAQDRLDGF
jgi:putative transposase